MTTVDEGVGGASAHGEGRRVVELAGRIAQSVTLLVRAEFELAVLEARRRAKQAAAGGVLIATAAVLALAGVGCAAVAALLALTLVVSPWFAAGIVAAFLLFVGGLVLAPGWRGITGDKGATPGLLRSNIKADLAAVREAARQ